MRKAFLYPITSELLFCRRCQKVCSHQIFAREPYSTRGGIRPHIPLLCSCKICSTYFIAFSQEFNFFCDSHKSEYVKILGHNRIIPGNWLYVKGTPRPGKVKGVFHSATEEIIVISYNNGPDQKIERPFNEEEVEEYPQGYRLLPVQSGQTLIGDPIYHVPRDAFGKVVGIVSDGEKEKLAVLLDNNILLFMTLPEAYQTTPNAQLHELIRFKLKDTFPEVISALSYEVAQGIVFIKGNVPNIRLKKEIRQFLENIPAVRGCVDFIQVDPSVTISDNLLKSNVLSVLEDLSLPIFDYDVNVENGKVTVRCYFSFEATPADLEKRLEVLEGIRELSLLLELSPSETNTHKILCLNAARALKEHPKLKDTCIRVSCNGKKMILEGRVHSILQKSQAYFTAIRSTKKVSIDNKLRIVQPSEE
jgi:osmotically-inducible protein OsmY